MEKLPTTANPAVAYKQFCGKKSIKEKIRYNRRIPQRLLSRLDPLL